MKYTTTKSNLYIFVIQTIDGKNIDEFNLGKNSKTILKKLKYFWDKDTTGDFKAQLLNTKKLSLSIAKRMILDEQGKERRRRIKKEFNKDRK